MVIRIPRRVAAASMTCATVLQGTRERPHARATHTTSLKYSSLRKFSNEDEEAAALRIEIRYFSTSV